MTLAIQLKSCGERIKRARLLAGISTRREFEKKHGISANTLQSWEQDRSSLTVKGARRLVTALKQEGWICSAEWLLQGSGLPPRQYEPSSKHKTGISNNEFLTDPQLQEDEKIYREIQFFKKNNPNAIVITIEDDSMEPFFSIGDVIGGIQFFDKPIREYLGRLCILELEHNQIIPRYLQAGAKPDTFTASCSNPKAKTAPLNIYDTKIISAAPILWHRKKIF